MMLNEECMAERYYQVNDTLLADRHKRDRERFWQDTLAIERYCDAIEELDRRVRARGSFTRTIQGD